jgi:hypothetical protein
MHSAENNASKEEVKDRIILYTHYFLIGTTMFS